MRHKVSELEGAWLDAAVAKAEGSVWKILQGRCAVEELGYAIGGGTGCWLPYEPSIEWMQGGPIIERERLMLKPNLVNGDWFGEWRSVCLSWPEREYADMTGSAPLVAAMRAYVASKFGDEVELP